VVDVDVLVGPAVVVEVVDVDVDVLVGAAVVVDVLVDVVVVGPEVVVEVVDVEVEVDVVEVDVEVVEVEVEVEVVEVVDVVLVGGATVVVEVVVCGIGDIIGKGVMYLLLVKNRASGVVLICRGSPKVVL
jgi:hypothetical protein